MTLGEFFGLYKNVLGFFRVLGVIPFVWCQKLATAGQPSLHGYYACMVFWAQGAFWRNCRQNIRKTFFFVSRFWVFLCSRHSSIWWRGTPVWHLWIGRARHPGPGAARFAVEVFIVGGWLTHGDLVLDTEVDFLTVVEHRSILARARGEWARLGRKGLAIVWAPASQNTSHVGHAGVGVVRLRGAPLSLLTFATAQF